MPPLAVVALGCLVFCGVLLWVLKHAPDEEPW